MAQKNKVLSRFLIDISSAICGFAIGLLCLYFFRGGVSIPLNNGDYLILVSTIFTALVLSSVFHKNIARMLNPTES